MKDKRKKTRELKVIVPKKAWPSGVNQAEDARRRMAREVAFSNGLAIISSQMGSTGRWVEARAIHLSED